jgi:hypothetical protein
MTLTAPTDVPAIYDRQGEWTALCVDQQEDDLYQVRTYSGGHPRSPQLRLPAIKLWLSNRGYTCPDLT